MNVIFADTLFLVNFSMDFLALFIAGTGLKCRIRAGRLALAALLGATFATLCVIFDSGEPIVTLIWTGAFVSCAAAMCAIAFDGRVLRCTAVFTAVNFGLGGLMSVLLSGVRRLGYRLDGSMLTLPTLLVFALISGAVSFIYCRIRAVGRREVKAEVELGGSTIVYSLLVDSGNLLCEPIGGLPVIIVKPRDSLCELDMSSPPPGLAHRLRLIPASSVTGERLICGVVPDKVRLDGREVSAVIAPCDGSYGGLDGIAPGILV